MTDEQNKSGCLFPPEQIQSCREPVLISACFLGVPCRWHGRRAKRRDDLIQKLKNRYVLVPVCPEQLGGMPTPRTSETLHGTGAQVLDEGLRLVAPETGRDVTHFHVNGARYLCEIAQIVGARRAYLKGGSPSCDRDGVAGEMLRRDGVNVVRVP
ncbi:MAG: DUF523 domain-containing protein [Phycisphaerae bacterium]|nr:DUF523 domain-containing protein [Phycisphaerae bacterium]